MAVRDPVEFINKQGVRVGNEVSLGVGGNEVSDDNPVPAEYAGHTWNESYQYTTSADATGGVNITGLPAVGERIVITDILISTDVDMLFSFQEETSGTVIAAMYIAAAIPIQFTPQSKTELPNINRRLRGVASIAGNIYVTIWWYSE